GDDGRCAVVEGLPCGARVDSVFGCAPALAAADAVAASFAADDGCAGFEAPTLPGWDEEGSAAGFVSLSDFEPISVAFRSSVACGRFAAPGSGVCGSSLPGPARFVMR